MALAFDIALDGEKELLQALGKLPEKTQRRIVPAAMRRGLKEIVLPALLQVLAAGPPKPNPDKDRRRNAMAIAKIKRSGKGGLLRMGYALPERGTLGIDAKSKDYYPAFLEYGHGSVPAYSYIRKPADDNATRVFKLLGATIGKGITREAKKLAKSRGR